MSDDLKHSKVTTSTPQDDGTTNITTESFYDDLAYQLIEIEKQVETSKLTILKDIINCLELITRDGSPEVTIRIKARRKEPYLIVKRWTTSRESFNRR